MHTPSNALAARLEEEIRRMPIVDLHSHLFMGGGSCQARTLLDLVGYHFVEADLVTAGMAPETFADADPSDPESAYDAIQKAVPYLALCRNTGTFQCLESMLADLYGIESPLAQEHVRAVFDAVLASAADPDWPREVLCERLHARHILTQLSNRPRETGLPDGLIGYTRERAGFFAWDRMSELLAPEGEKLDSAKQIADAAEQFVAAALDDGATSFTTHLPADFVFVDADAEEVDRAGLADEAALSSYALGSVFAAMDMQAAAIVISVGAFWPAFPTAPGGPRTRSIAEFAPGTMKSLGAVAARFPRVNFFIILASPVMNHDLAMLAKMVSNVIPTGYWWHVMYTGFAGRLLTERLDIVPHNKLVGFFSDGYHAEWCYAKWRVVARETALALARKVEEGYYSEEFALQLARRLFCENPAELYGLEGSE